MIILMKMRLTHKQDPVQDNQFPVNEDGGHPNGSVFGWNCFFLEGNSRPKAQGIHFFLFGIAMIGGREYSKISPTGPPLLIPKGPFTNSFCWGISFDLWGLGKSGGPSSQCGPNH